MTLVIIFGPPAVGKMAVGMEMEHLTGFRLFRVLRCSTDRAGLTGLQVLAAGKLALENRTDARERRAVLRLPV
jgi:hypothetical protein